MHRREGAREDAGVTRRILTPWVIYDNPLGYPRPTKKGPDERGVIGGPSNRADRSRQGLVDCAGHGFHW